MKKLAFVVIFGALFLVACGGSDEVVIEDNTPVVADVNCSSGWERYELADTTMKFCYDPAWGEVITGVSDAAEGEAHTITFANHLNDLQIWYVSKDFKAPEGENAVSFGSFNLFGKEEWVVESVANAFATTEDGISARKNDIGGHRGVRAHVTNQDNIYGHGDTVGIYVPDAFGDYHLAVVGKAALAEEVDMLSFDMVF